MAAGLSAERLYRYRDEGHLEQIGRGLYRRANAAPADHNLIEIAHRAPEGTLCLITALARHGLTDVIPDRIDVAIPRGRRIPALQSPTNIPVFAKDTFGLGREVIRVGEGLILGLYSPERSLVDMVSERRKLVQNGSASEGPIAMPSTSRVPSVGIYGYGNYCGNRHNPAGLPHFQVRGIDLHVRPVALDRAVQEGIDPLVDLRAQPRDLAHAHTFTSSSTERVEMPCT